jgi:hypothetical protein
MIIYGNIRSYAIIYDIGVQPIVDLFIYGDYRRLIIRCHAQIVIRLKRGVY